MQVTKFQKWWFDVIRIGGVIDNYIRFGKTYLMLYCFKWMRGEHHWTPSETIRCQKIRSAGKWLGIIVTRYKYIHIYNIPNIYICIYIYTIYIYIYIYNIQYIYIHIYIYIHLGNFHNMQKSQCFGAQLIHPGGRPGNLRTFFFVGLSLGQLG